MYGQNGCWMCEISELADSREGHAGAAAPESIMQAAELKVDWVSSKKHATQ